jgi:hypothetical protein
VAVGFIIKDASDNTLIESTETTALLEERIVETGLVSGNKTYTGITNKTAYAVGIPESNGNIAAGTWTGVNFNISSTISNSHPKVSWDITCTGHALDYGQDCADWSKFHIFVFIK